MYVLGERVGCVCVEVCGGENAGMCFCGGGVI